MSTTGHSDVDMESASAFSPSEPAIDEVFVSKHNQSAEIYQIFKDDVDALLSGRTPQHEQAALIQDLNTCMNQRKVLILQRILHTSENLYVVFEDEKQHLMGDVLLSWAMKQQRVSIGTLWTQQLHYKQLDVIHLQFEYYTSIGELLQQTLSGLTYLKQYFPSPSFDEAYNRFCSMAHYFLYYSVIVSRQPPSVVVKCGEAENHRRSRFWFNTEIRS
ncbi:RING-CH-type domain-containing protein [Trichostrongylus colubriformis]|uniref:RING-CH-type domain-containing protein n=1 Tax=Trichostrongylus colubriformis TaxID=6319 RepID=A0AAN8FD30_TRICO